LAYYIRIGPILIAVGLFIVLIGTIITVLSKLGISKLPGDILIQKGNFTFYFPIVTMLLVSVVLTIIVNLFFRK